jgi:hypothetical protein
MSKRLLSLGCVLGLLALILTFPIESHADTVYSNLGSNPAYVSSGQLNETPSGFSNLIDGFPFEAVAVPFTPGGDFQLTQIDVAIQAVSPENLSNTPQVTMGLCAGSSNLPNNTALASGLPCMTALATWSLGVGTGIPAHFTCCPLDTATFSGITIQGGQQYWIVAIPWPATADTWEYSNVGQSGGWLTNIGTFSVQFGSWTSVDPNAPMPAFDVLGTPVSASEPPALLLLGCGIVGLLLFRRFAHQQV